MTNKLLIIFFFFSTITLIQAQKKYEVLKIDKNAFETMNVIYLKKKFIIGNRIYRIITPKNDTIIAGKKVIGIGDTISLRLIEAKNEIGIKDGFFQKPDKTTFFYHDTYEGKDVDIRFYCPDFIILYHIEN